MPRGIAASTATRTPLANRHCRDPTVYQMFGSIGHPPPPTRIAKAPVLAGIGKQPVFAALRAPKPQKASLQNSTVQIRPKFPLNESRYCAFAFLSPGKKRFQVLRDNRIEDCGFRTAGTIGSRRIVHASKFRASTPPLLRYGNRGLRWLRSGKSRIFRKSFPPFSPTYCQRHKRWSLHSRTGSPKHSRRRIHSRRSGRQNNRRSADPSGIVFRTSEFPIHH